MLKYLKDVQDAAIDNLGWVMLFLSTLALVTVWRLSKRKSQPLSEMRDITMTVEGRRMHINRVFIERTGDALLEAVFQGEITEQEANDRYGWLARQMKQDDLIPLIQKKKQPMLKAQLQANKRRRSLGKKEAPLPLPSPKSDPKPNGAVPDLHAILNP